MLKSISRQSFQIWELSSFFSLDNETFKYEEFIPHQKPDLKYKQYKWIQNASTKIKHWVTLEKKTNTTAAFLNIKQNL